MKTIDINSSERVRIEYYFTNDGEICDKKIFMPHLHDKIEIYVLMSGSSAFAVDGEIVELSPFDALLIPPMTMHHCILPEPSTHDHMCFWASGLPSVFEGITNNGYVLHRKADGFFADIKSACDYFISNINDAADDVGALKHFLDLLYCFKTEKDKSFTVQAGANVALPAELKRVLADVKENFAEIRTVQEVAKRNYVSVSTLTRLFKNHLKVTPKEYVEAQRFSMAKLYLGEGYSVKEASEKAGFSDCSNFIRSFKNKYSVTPDKYRKNYKSD